MNLNEDPYMYNTKAYGRLLEDYLKHKTLIVGFDFDDTVYDCHKKGYTYDGTISLLKRAHALGFILVCWSANTNRDLIESEMEKHRIDFKWESPVKFEGSKKEYFNILLDDRAGLFSAAQTLHAVMKHIEDNHD